MAAKIFLAPVTCPWREASDASARYISLASPSDDFGGHVAILKLLRLSDEIQTPNILLYSQISRSGSPFVE